MDRAFLRPIVFPIILASLLLWPQRGSAQLYFGGYVGAEIPHTADTSPDDSFFREALARARSGGVDVIAFTADFSDSEFDPGVAFGGKVGYWFEGLNMPFLGLEAEAGAAFPKLKDKSLTMDVDYFSASGATASFRFPIQEAELRVYSASVNLLARYPFGTLQPYGGAGFVLARGELSKLKPSSIASASLDGKVVSLTDSDDEIFADIEDTTAALQLIGGLKGFLSHDTALYLEYRYLQTEFDFRGVEMDYNASSVLGGIEFYLGRGYPEERRR